MDPGSPPSPAGTSTGTPLDAREHARAQAGATAATMQTIPARDATDLPAGIAADDVVWVETLPEGGYAARVLARGTRLRLTDVTGGACVQLLAYDASNPVERLNVADTVKVQWNAYLGEKMLLLSDMGRVLLSITADTGAGHDALCGCSPAARDRLLLGLTRFGLGRADLTHNVNLFSRVRVTEDGDLVHDGGAAAGATVELRAEMDVLVVLAVTPHVLEREDVDENAGEPRVGIVAFHGPPTAADDPCRTAGPEAARAFDNTDDRILR